MTHEEVLDLEVRINNLIAHFLEEGIKNFNLNYGLNKNLDRITEAAQEVRKGAVPELLQLEEKAFKLAKKEPIKEESRNEAYLRGVSLLSEEEQKRHKELMEDYDKYLQEENDLQLYLIDPKKIESIEVDFRATRSLDIFLKKDE